MHEQLPVLRDAINQLEQTNQPLANELSGLVEELSAQLEKKQLDAIQATEEKIHNFLEKHEKEVTIGDRKQELDTLKTTISSASATQPASQPASQPTSRWSSLRGTDNDEATTSTSSPSSTPAEPEEQTSRRERWGKTGATWIAGISALLATLQRWKNRSGTQAQDIQSPSPVPNQNNTPPASNPDTPSPAPGEKPLNNFPSQKEYEGQEPKEKRLVCMRYLIENLNYPLHISAGIIGNIQKESGFKSNARGDGNTSYGLCQRHDEPNNKKHRRRTALKEYTAQYGHGKPEYITQLNFIKYELEGAEGDAWKQLQKAKNASQAAELFCTEYERPDSKYAHLDLRKKYAKEAYHNYQGSL